MRSVTPAPTVALCWELGGGYGHLTTLLPLARGFIERGWRVALLSRKLPSAGQVFAKEIADGSVTLLPAPMRHGSAFQYDATPTYAYILFNVGWADAATLGPLVEGWRNSLRLLNADLVVADHAPTALLAARSLALPAVVWGAGFFLPPDSEPLPDLMPWRRTASEQMRAVEATALDAANAVLAGHRTPPLEHFHIYRSQCYTLGVRWKQLGF